MLVELETVIRARICPEDSAIERRLAGKIGVNDRLGLVGSL
jgi:hypothetical protein